MSRKAMLILALVVGVLPGCGYNRIQELDEGAEQQRANVATELVNRNNLIPNLVATVEGASEFERGTITDVTRARAGLDAAREQLSQAADSGSVAQISAADAEVTRQIGTYINIAVEAYPQLRATENFSALQDQLAESENRISVARRDYNEAVQAYNTYIRSFPQAITAKFSGAERKEPFQAPPGAEQTPTVDFSRPGN